MVPDRVEVLTLSQPKVNYVEDPMMPYYVSYDDSQLLDRELKRGETVIIPFTRPEKVSRIEVISPETMELEFTMEGETYTVLVQKGDNLFRIGSKGSISSIEITMTMGPEEGLDISHILLQAYQQLSHAEYEIYLRKESWLDEVQLVFNWTMDPRLNLSFMDDYRKLYSEDEVGLMGKNLDFTVLEAAPTECIGHPIIISGLLDHIEGGVGKLKVTGLDSFLTLHNLEGLQEDTYYNLIAVYVGYKEGLHFYLYNEIQ